SQAAQLARQLATGERASSIQILDLGLSDNRTYLVAPGNSDVEDLLALLTNEEVYVEPFFTEALGTELFGESRSHTPQTFEDDEASSKRPEFLNKLSNRIDDWLHEDSDEAPVVPDQYSSTDKAAANAAAAAAAARQNRKPAEDQQTEDEGVTEREEPPTPAMS